MAKSEVKTYKQLSRMTRVQLAEYAAKEMRLPESSCYEFQGGPRKKGLLIATIENAQLRKKLDDAFPAKSI